MLTFKVLVGGSWMLFSRLVSRGIDFITLLVLARFLSPADFGVAALAASLVAVVDMVIELPVTQALVRLPHLDQQHLDTCFTLGVFRGLLVAIILPAAAWLYAYINNDPTLMPLIGVLAIGLILRSLASPAMVHFNKNLQFRPIFFSEILGRLAAFCAALSSLAAGFGYWAIIINTVTTAVVTSILSYILAPYRPRLSLARLSDFAEFFGWFNAAQIVGALNWQFDRILIGTFSANAMLGRFVIAEDMATFPTKTLVGPALQPVMAGFSQINADADRLRAAFLKAIRFVMAVSLPISIGISLTSDLAVSILLGGKWEGTSLYLSVIALAVLPVPFSQTFSAACYAVDRPNILFKLTLTEICIRFILIPSAYYFAYINGIVFARLILSIVMFFCYLRCAKMLFHVSIRDQCHNLSKLVLAAIVMSVAVLIIRHFIASYALGSIIELIIVSAVGAAVYLGTLFLLGIRLIIGKNRLELADEMHWSLGS